MNRSLRLMILLSAIGCGSKSNQPPDAHPTVDSPTAIDAPSAIDAPPAIDATTVGTGKVTVVDAQGAGTPAAFIPVVFIDPDGSLVANVMTDISGKAQADVLPGASVSAVWLTSPGQYRIQTVLAVKPGDDLVLGSVLPDSTAAGTFTVTFGPVAGASFYYVYGPCGNVLTSGTSAMLNMTNDCKQSPMEIQVHATDPTGAGIGYIDHLGIPFMPGGNVSLGSPSMPYQTLNAQYSNVPSAVMSVNLVRAAPDGFGYMSNGSGVPMGGMLSLNTQGPWTSTAQAQSIFTNASGSRQEVKEVIAGNATTYSLDAGGKLLAWVSMPTLDPTTGIISVPVDATGTSGDAPDLFVLHQLFGRAGTDIDWTIFGPSPSDVTLPHLPASVGAVNPMAGDFASPGQVTIADADDIAGYDAIRNNVYAATNAFYASRGTATLVRISASPAFP
jgi:hypothetical protein